MFTTIINDCADTNAIGRQKTKSSILFKCPINFVGVNSDIEASGNLIDILDSCQGERGIILVNVAPRNGKAKHWQNGTPFGYFYYQETLIVSSIDGFTLSLVKKLKLANEIKVLDLKKSVHTMAKNNIINSKEINKIINTQFRSLEFLPLTGYCLINKQSLPSKNMPIYKISNTPNAIWFIDNFGNCKTTLLENEICEFKNTKLNFDYYNRLKDVPDKKTALITGSSGIDDNKFIEIVIQGGNAAKKYNLQSGNNLNI